jgi:uncharacterized heparinase superfamily protein
MLYYHTIRYLKPIQVFGRFWFYLKKPSVNPSLPPLVYHLPKQWTLPANKPISLIGLKTFRLLNREYRLTQPNDWQNPQMEKLFLYHLHYFDDLNAKKAAHRQIWQTDAIHYWIQDNPIGYGIGWEPYPTSLRIVNWIKWILNGNLPTAEMIGSLTTQVNYLRQRLEWHLLGNHLLANAKALLFAGLFFQEKKWTTIGLKILNKQFSEQILADGGHFERSTLYHGIVLEDLLDCINILQSYYQDMPTPWRGYASKMLSWLKGMLHPDGDIALFNDAALQSAAHPAELFAYADRLKLDFQAAPRTTANDSVFFQHSGYAHINTGKAHVFVDTAPIGPDYLPGHAHADTLTFECSLNQQRMIVNSGTSIYESGKERLRQRGTAAHNTVVIDQHNSSNIWSSFRVAQRARVFDVAFQSHPTPKITAAHNGYRRLPGKIIHRRTWTLDECSLMIADEMSGAGRHHLQIPLHFYPGLDIEKIDDSRFAIKKAGQLMAQIVFDSNLNTKISFSSFHPEFGLALTNQKLVSEITAELPLKLITKVIWS